MPCSQKAAPSKATVDSTSPDSGQAVPYKVHTVLTDNVTHFTSPGNTCSAAAEIKLAIERGELFMANAFEYACAQNDIDHRLNKPKHPWTNGQVERMNRTLKEATVKRFYYYEYICSIWTKEPQKFKLNPTHLSLEPNT